MAKKIYENNYNNNNNNKIQVFIIYVLSQELQGQLQTQHSVDTGNYIVDKHNIKSKTNYRQALEENTLMLKTKQTKKQTNKQTKMKRGNKYMITKNYIAQEHQDYEQLLLTISGRRL
jgi:hypothetical protein